MSAFLAFIDDDGQIGMDDKAGFKAHVDRLKGQEVVVTVKRRPKFQGSKQLRYLRGVVIPDVAEACGYNPEDPDECEEVYDGIMWRLFRLPDGKFGQPRRESCARSEMSLERLSQVIDTIIRWAETTIVGCTVRRPEEVDIDRIPDREFV